MKNSSISSRTSRPSSRTRTPPRGSRRAPTRFLWAGETLPSCVRRRDEVARPLAASSDHLRPSVSASNCAAPSADTRFITSNFENYLHLFVLTFSIFDFGRALAAASPISIQEHTTRSTCSAPRERRCWRWRAGLSRKCGNRTPRAGFTREGCLTGTRYASDESAAAASEVV